MTVYQHPGAPGERRFTCRFSRKWSTFIPWRTDGPGFLLVEWDEDRRGVQRVKVAEMSHRTALRIIGKMRPEDRALLSRLAAGEGGER